MKTENEQHSKSVTILLCLVALTMLLNWSTNLSRQTKQTTTSVKLLIEKINTNYQPHIPHNSTKKTISLWSNDNHIGPIEDLKYIVSNFFTEYNFVFYDNSISVYCRFVGTCAKETIPINFESSLAITNSVKKHYFNEIKLNPMFQQADILFCSHPPPICQLFLAFNKWKSIISVTAVPFLYSSKNMFEWEENYHKMLENPKNIVISNNLMGSLDINFHLGKQPKVLRSLCLYARKQVGGVYSDFHLKRQENIPQKGSVNMKKFLLSRGSCDYLIDKFKTSSGRFIEHGIEVDISPSSFDHRRILENYNAVIFTPYTSSLMSFFEYYILNIPMFVPSVKFLVEMEKFDSFCVRGVPPDDRWKLRHIKPLINPNAQKLFDEFGIASLKNDTTHPWWLQKMDYYDQNEFPNLIYYDSIDDLMAKAKNLTTNNFLDISAKIEESNKNSIERIVGEWKTEFARILKFKEENKFLSVFRESFESATQASGYIIQN